MIKRRPGDKAVTLETIHALQEEIDEEDLQVMPDAVLYQFSRSLVEVRDATDFLKHFGRYRLPVGRQLGAMMNHLALFIEGYDDDPREIYAIPEVRKFYQQLWQRWPYWLYFCNLDTENLMMMVMCCNLVV